MARPAIKRCVAALDFAVLFLMMAASPFRGRMIDGQIETASLKWISEPALLIRRHEDEWNGPRLDGAHLGDGKCPCRKQLEQECFKRVVYFIYFLPSPLARLPVPSAMRFFGPHCMWLFFARQKFAASRPWNRCPKNN